MNTLNAQGHYIVSIYTLNAISSIFPACYELLLYGGKYHMPVSTPSNFRVACVQALPSGMEERLGKGYLGGGVQI
jgi:hypothetical protein